MITSNVSNGLSTSYAQVAFSGRNTQDPRSQLDLNSSLKPLQEVAAGAPLQSRRDDRTGAANTPDTRQPAAQAGSSVEGEEGPSALPRQEQDRLQQQREKQQLLEEQRQIFELSTRDREVRAHEQAHAAVGGQYAGAPSYQFQRGPDGINYAVSGEVPIDVGAAATPQETLQKAQVVRRAALAPAEPSPQDRRVAAQATRLESQARAEIAVERVEESQKADELKESQQENPSTESAAITPATAPVGDAERTGQTSDSRKDRDDSARPLSISSNTGLANTSIRQILAISNSSPNSPGALLDLMV